MFSTAELDWTKSLIGTMSQQGYTNYLIYTDSTNSDYDFICVFSKSEIISNSLYSYVVTDGIRYRVNSNSYNWQDSESMLDVGNFSGNLNIPDYETVYSNCNYTVEGIVQPDVVFNQDAGKSIFNGWTILFVLVGIFLLIIAFKFFRRR